MSISFAEPGQAGFTRRSVAIAVTLAIAGVVQVQLAGQYHYLLRMWSEV